VNTKKEGMAEFDDHNQGILNKIPSIVSRQKLEYRLVPRRDFKRRLEYWRQNRALVGISIPIILVAFFLRIWNLGYAPQFRTDELAENAIGSGILYGTLHEPVLLNINDFASSLYNHLAALSFLVFGLNPISPLYVILIACTITAFIVIVLARRMFNNSLLAGGIAGILFAVSFYAIVETAHRGWSISLTPLFATAATFLFYKALQTKSSTQVFAATFVTGLAIQTHPVAIILPIAFLIFLIWSKGYHGLSARKHLPLGVIGLVAGVLPLILAPYFNHVNPLSAVSHSDWTGLYGGFSLVKYSNMAVRLMQAFSVVVSPVWYGFTNPISILPSIVFSVGVLIAAIRRNTADKMVLSQFLVYFLVVPAGIATPAPRYIAFMLPLVYIAMTSVFMTIYKVKRRLGSTTSIGRRLVYSMSSIFSYGGIKFIAISLLILGLLIPSFLTLQGFYATAAKGYETDRDQSTNVGYMQALYVIRSKNPQYVVLDENSSNFRPCCSNGVIHELLKEMNYDVVVPYSASPDAYYSRFKNQLQTGTIVFVFIRSSGQLNNYESAFLSNFPGSNPISIDNIGKNQQLIIYAITM
jgi:hypothetical protein